VQLAALRARRRPIAMLGKSWSFLVATTYHRPYAAVKRSTQIRKALLTFMALEARWHKHDATHVSFLVTLPYVCVCREYHDNVPMHMINLALCVCNPQDLLVLEDGDCRAWMFPAL
jgi:hypothetical protein